MAKILPHHRAQILGEEYCGLTRGLNNNLLNSCAEKTNQTVQYSVNSSPTSRGSPRFIRISQKQLLKTHKKVTELMKSNLNITVAKEEFNKARNSHRKLLRKVKARDSIKIYEKLYYICFKTPFSIYSSTRRSKLGKSGKIRKLTVIELILVK